MGIVLILSGAAVGAVGAGVDGSGPLRRPDWNWDACTAFGMVSMCGPIPAFVMEETSMIRHRISVIRHLMPLMVFVGLWLGGVCRGQVFVSGVEVGEPSLDVRIVDEYARILELDAAHMEAVEAIRGGAARELQRARVERAELSDDLRAEATEIGDFSILADEMPEIQERFRVEAERIERRFLDDLRLLLTPEQGERWPEVLRAKRRLAELPNGVLAGESLDVVFLAREFEFPEESQESLDAALHRYSADIDVKLAHRADIAQDDPMGKVMRGVGGRIDLDMESLIAHQERMRAARLAVREVNMRAARQVAGLLSGEERERFELQVRRRAYPMAYRETHAMRTLDSAMQFADLEGEQRERLEGIRERYGRSSAVLEERMMRAVDAVEEEGGVAGPGRGSMVMRINVEQSDAERALEEVRTERRELERETLRSVREALTPEQRERLPRREVTPGPGVQRSAVFQTTTGGR